MTPYKYTIKNGETTFHYTFSQLRAFITEGKTNGGTEWTVYKRNGNLVSFVGYGNFQRDYFHSKHLEFINGVMPTDDQRLLPPKPMVFKRDCIVMRQTQNLNSLNQYV